MTLVIGIEDPENGRAIVAADSGLWSGNIWGRTRVDKVWRSGSWIVGAAGAFREFQILRSLPLPELGAPAEAPLDRISAALGSWALEAQTELAKHATIARDIDKNDGCDGPVVIAALGSQVWWVVNGCASTIDLGYMAAGAAQFGMGALAALGLCGPLKPLDRARTAFEAVRSVCDAVIPPYRWLDTQGGEGTFES